MYKQNISNDEVSELPNIQFEGDIYIVHTQEAQLQAAEYLAQQKLLGFDTESRPTFTKGAQDKISLVQISSFERAYLFRVNLEPLIPEILKILQSRKIIKIGLALHDDLKRVASVSRKFYPRSFIDLQSIVYEYGIKELSLKKISGIVLSAKISKAQRLSNWNANYLTESQSRYAATDAWVCIEIYSKLLKSDKIEITSTVSKIETKKTALDTKKQETANE